MYRPAILFLALTFSPAFAMAQQPYGMQQVLTGIDK